MSKSCKPLADRDIPWALDGPVPWPSSRPVVDVALELIPILEDPLAAQLVENLMLALVAREEELRAVRTILAAALEHAHALHLVERRLHVQVVELREAGRCEQRKATTT
jgi:hypothetical protein